MKVSIKIFLITLIIFSVLSTVFFIKFFSNKEAQTPNVYNFSTIKFRDLWFDTLEVEPHNIDLLTFYYKDKENNKITDIEYLKNILKKQNKKLIFAVNGGIFSPTFEPLGLYIENEKTISELNSSTGEGNFYLQPNGVFLIDKNGAKIVETKNYKDTTNTLYAIQSGPLLVIDGKINLSFDELSQNKYIRNGVGTDKNGNVFFVISNQPVTFYEFAEFFKKELICNNALYLDGAISEMYIPGKREKTENMFGIIIGIAN